MSSKDPEPKQSPDRETLNSPESKQLPEEARNEEVSDEEGECGFCLFMKAGGCKESFVGWENCIKEAEENKEEVTRKCFEATSALMKCMAAHGDYYDPLLRAEKKAEEEALKEIQKEKEMDDSASHQDSKDLNNK